MESKADDVIIVFTSTTNAGTSTVANGYCKKVVFDSDLSNGAITKQLQIKKLGDRLVINTPSMDDFCESEVIRNLKNIFGSASKFKLFMSWK